MDKPSKIYTTFNYRKLSKKSNNEKIGFLGDNFGT